MTNLPRVKLTWEQIRGIELASDRFARFFKISDGDFERGINLLFGEMRDQGINDYFLMIKWEGDFYKARMSGKIITINKVIVEPKK